MAQRDEPPAKQRNFAYCIRPIYYFARVAGQMPFTITHQPNSSIVKVNLFKRDIIWLIMSMCIQVFLICEAIREFKSEKSSWSTLYFSSITVWVVSLVLGVCVMLLDAYNRYKFERILNEFTIFDKEVRASSYK